MRTIIGLVLCLVGGVIILGGFAYAVLALAGMYQGALENALADSNEAAVANRMWTGAIVGSAGIPVFLIGSFVMGRGLLARLLGGGRNRSRNV